MALFYLDASALVKLLCDEEGSDALRAFLLDAEMVSCDLALAELARAVRRASARDRRLPLADLLQRTAELMEAVALVPVDRPVLLEAGALPEPSLRTLDAVHVAAAVSLPVLDAFVTYDERQGAAARLAGLRTVSPGA